MPLKKSTGNMYDWVTHMHTHLRGRCPHECSYCYVQHMRCSRFYQGEPRLKEDELHVNYGKGKIIFIEHMNDMFADGIPKDWIMDILWHCWEYPDNQYVFQTKNPSKAFYYRDDIPSNSLIGTTIETNRDIGVMSKAPSPCIRFMAMTELSKEFDTFVTIEPIMDMDVDMMIDWLGAINPKFVNIGADSKRCGLPEPSKEKIELLIEGLNKIKVPIKKKVNLGRLMK